MGEFQQLDVGQIGLIQEMEDGRIVQLALTEDQSKSLQIFIAAMSQHKPVVRLGEEYELILKSSK